MRSLIEPLAMPILRFATRSYTTGPDVADAMKLAGAVAVRGMPSTICYWNDGKEEPAAVLQRYLDSLDAMAVSGHDADLAVKIPALWDRRDLVATIVERARSLNKRVVFDSHAPAQSELTFDVMSELGSANLGCAIPGRWKRSIGDAERAVQLGLRVRVIKGQWPDPDEPDMDVGEGFLRVVDVLAGRAVHVGVATHDASLAREAIRRLLAAGTPCEHELLFPLPMEPSATAARDAGIKTRLYIPFGEAWLPYSISRAMENPRVLVWLLRDLFSGRRLKC